MKKVGLVTLGRLTDSEHIRPVAVKSFFATHKVPFESIGLDLKGLSGKGRSHVSFEHLAWIAWQTSKRARFWRRHAIGKEIHARRAVEGLKKVMKHAHDWLCSKYGHITLFHAETQIPAYVCNLVKQATGIPYVFDMRGLLVDENTAVAVHKSLIDYYKELEKTAVTEALKVIVVSNAMQQYVIDNYNCSPENIIVIPNAAAVTSLRAVHKKEMNIIYGGAFDYWERVEDYLEMVQIMQNGQYHFHLMGDGSTRKQYIDYMNAHYLDICYLGRKSVEDARKIFATMQVGIAPSTRDIVRKVASPLKIFGYASCGLPIVTVNVGEWSDIIKEYDCGIVTENSSAEEFADAARQLQNKRVWEQKSENGKKMIREKYNWATVMQPLREIYGDYPS